MAEPVEAIADPRPLDEIEQLVADALYLDVWTTPRADDPDWHHRFRWWQAVQAARLSVAALRAAGLIEARHSARSTGGEK